MTRRGELILTRRQALGLLALALGAALFYNSKLNNGEPEPLSPEEAQVNSGVTVMIAIQAIETYRREHGRLPESMEELGFPEGTLEYRIRGEHYEVSAPAAGGEAVEFSSEKGPLGILEEMGVTVGGPPKLPDGIDP